MAAASPERAELISSASPVTPPSSCVLADTNGSRRLTSSDGTACHMRRFHISRVKVHRVKRRRSGVTPDRCWPLIQRDDELRVKQRARPDRRDARGAPGTLARRERRLGLAAPLGLVPPGRRRARDRPALRGRPRRRRHGAGPRPGLRRRRDRRDAGRPGLPVPDPRCRRAADGRRARPVRGLGRRPGRRRRRSAPRWTPSRGCRAASTWRSGSRRPTATRRCPPSAHAPSPTSGTTWWSSTSPPGTSTRSPGPPGPPRWEPR